MITIFFSTLRILVHKTDYFDDELENAAVEFLTEYDSDCEYESAKLSLVEEIINSNFTQEEIICAINSLKPNRSPGINCCSGRICEGLQGVLS